MLDMETAFPSDRLHSELDEAGRKAPEDDRVWLGKANLAVRLARFDEADEWLQKCLARRPDDPVVWRARLDLAIVADRFDAAVEALRHLPADRLTPARQLIRAGLAGRPSRERGSRTIGTLQSWWTSIPPTARP